MPKQLSIAIITGLIVSIVTQLLRAIFNFLLTGLILVLGEKRVTELFPTVAWVFFTVLLIGFIILILIAIQLGSIPYPIQNVREPIGHKFSRWQKFIGLNKVWTQFRLTLLSGIFVMSVVIFHGMATSFGTAHYVLIFLITADVILQFFVASGDIRNTLNRSIAQLMINLHEQILFVVRETCSDSDINIRLRLLLFNPKDNTLFVRYHYGMEGDQDLELCVSATQGVIGRVFNQGRPWVRSPYNPNDLDLNPKQIALIPVSIKWKMGLPIKAERKSFGVLAFDCNKELDLLRLKEIETYALGITKSISMLMAQFPSDAVQRALKEQ